MTDRAKWVDATKKPLRSEEKFVLVDGDFRCVVEECNIFSSREWSWCVAHESDASHEHSLRGDALTKEEAILNAELAKQWLESFLLTIGVLKSSDEL